MVQHPELDAASEVERINEIAAIITRDALAGLEQLLNGQAPGELIECSRVGALARVVHRQAERILR